MSLLRSANPKTSKGGSSMTNKKLGHAISLALTSSAMMGLSAPVMAQDQDEDAATLDRIRVTGSKISRADVESASPVFIIQREDIERTGLTSVGDLLQDLPIAGSALNTQFNNGGNGQTQIDLRNLGVRRVLVLLNGRRFSSFLGTPGNVGVDLNNIPVAVVKRIEILKDGASSIYGSDAISGVVNIITRDDFEGMQANAYIGQYGSENDGEQQAYDFSVGSTTDRGSVFFNASFVKSEAAFSGDRRISAEPQFGTGNAFGSSGTAQGRFGANVLDGFGITSDPGTDVAALGAAAFRPGDFSFGAPGSGADRFNFAPDNYLLTPQTRTNIFTQAVYELTDDVRMSVEAQFNNRKSDQLLAPTPLFLGIFGANLAANVGIAADATFNPFGVQLNPSSSFLLGRRLVEAGPRIFRQDVDSYRFGMSFEGSFELGDRYFDWDVGYVYSDIDQSDINTGRVNIQRVANALSGAPCRNNAFNDGCVELNLFGGQGPDGNGTITPAMLNYILYTENEAFGSTLQDYTANVTGELMELPAGPLGFALGYEKRLEEGFDSPDALVSAGITSGTARQPTRGNFSVDEVFIELAIPLLSGVTGAERLDLSVSSRWSDYDTFGDTVNSKIGIEWQPIDDLLLRATFGEGFRAPSIGELFAGQGDSFPQLVDPCNGVDTTGDGLPDSNPGAPGCVGVPGTYAQANAQIRITQGSNPNLEPETSESTTVGFVYSPSWADGLDMTVDYYKVELENSITTVGAQTILNTCASTGSTLCNLLTRTPNGIVTQLLDAGTNIGGTEVEGVDMLVSYSFPESDWGFFRVVWDGAYQGTNANTVLGADGVSFVDINNLGLSIGDFAFTRWKSTLDLNWSYGDWEATYGMNYVHGSDEACAIPASFGFCNLGVDTDGDGINDVGNRDIDTDGDIDAADLGRHIGGATYHDTQVSYHLSEYDTRLSLGVNNLWDKGPPISTTAFANSFNVADYRVPGRFAYVRVTVDF